MSPPFNQNSFNSARNNPCQSTVRAYALFNKQTKAFILILYMCSLAKYYRGKTLK